MKHKAILLACAIIVAGSLALANHESNRALQVARAHASTVAKQVQQELSQNEARDKQLKEVQAKVTKLNTEVSRLQTECEVGLRDYDALTAYQKLQVTEPVCSLQNAAPLSQ